MAGGLRSPAPGADVGRHLPSRSRCRRCSFPPRHPTHLPTVIDEPSVFDYAPQHQSTCGLAFNDPVTGGPTFGPAPWAGDALVAGVSMARDPESAKPRIAYMSQRFGLYTDLTVQENLA